MERKVCCSYSKGESIHMIFEELELEGSFIITPEKIEDERGFFARTWDKKIFEGKNLNSNFTQSSISYNEKKGTVRGLHYQIEPFSETKLVRCTKGSVYEVILDIRKDSKTYKKWIGIKLNSNEYKFLYIPKGFALGFQSLEDNTELFYQITQMYSPEHAKGIRWNDKSFNILWPEKITVISTKDISYKPFQT